MKKIKILTLALVSITYLFMCTFVVKADDSSSQNVGLNLKPTITTSPETKTGDSQDLTKIWNVTFSANNLVWNIVQNQDGGSYYYEWNANQGVYTKHVVNAASLTTGLADGENVDRTITITNKSNLSIIIPPDEKAAAF